jgi:iron(III) transport system substrate-binding protein
LDAGKQLFRILPGEDAILNQHALICLFMPSPSRADALRPLVHLSRVLLAGMGLLLTLHLTASAQQSLPAAREADLYEAAKKEGKLVWYVGGPLDGMNAIAAEFEKDYPGVKVETMRLVGVQQYQRFMDETGAKKHLADVLQNTDYPSMLSLIEDGHIAEWKIPAFDRIPEMYRIKDFAYAQYTSANAIIYHENKLTEEEVKLLQSGWEAVLDPRFKGRFSVSPMKCGVCYAPIHMFLDPQFNGRYGPEFLKKLAESKPASYSEVLVAIDRVIAGEEDFTISGWEAAGAVKLRAGAPIRWLFPRPTPEYGNSWQGISVYAPHPNAARLFLDWTNNDKGAGAMERVYGSKSTLEGLADQRPYVKAPWYKPPVELYPVDQKRWDLNYHKDMDLWASLLKRAQ